MLKHYRIKIVFRIVLMLLICASSVICFVQVHWSMALPLWILLVYQVFDLIRFQNKIHDYVSYFFEAVLNDDFSFSMQTNSKNSILNRMNSNMQKLNAKIKSAITENEQREQYFKALIEHINIGVLTYDTDGFVLHANSSIMQLLSVSHLSHIKQLDRINHQLAVIIQQMKGQQQQLFTFEGPKTKHNLLIKSVPFVNQQQQLMLLTIQDIDQQLDEKELDSWLKLIRVLTHEIMNGIAPITSISESLHSYYCKEGKEIDVDEVNEGMIKNTVRGLSVITEQGKGLTRFVESYRKLTRLPKPKMELFSLAPFVEENVWLSKSGYLNHNVELKQIYPKEDIQTKGDTKLLNQVLLNILKNSFEAVQHTQSAQIKVTIDASLPSEVRLVVENNGPQIPKEILNDIFVPFFTTKENGSGVGLSISKQIMRMHGGSLKVFSNEKVTRFIIGLSR